MNKLVSFIVIVMVSTSSLATNGYFSHGYGTASKGMGGVGAALPLDTLSAASNPAAMFAVGERMDIGVSLFNPNRGYVADGNATSPPFGSIPAGRQDSESDFFLIPSFGRNWKLNDTSTFGISIGANGGMNTNYSENPFRNFGAATSPAGIDLAQIFMGLTWAHQLSERHTIGITPVVIVQSFKAQGLQPFQGSSLYPGNVSNRGRDWSYGGALRVGWLGKMSERLSLGASVQSRGYMSRFDKYKGLIAEKGDFDVPAQLVLGLAWKASEDVTVALDYQKIYFGQVKSIANTNNATLTAGSLGGDNGLGFGWDNMDVIKLGVEWKYSNDLTLRTGLIHASQVIDEKETLFNILAPAVIQTHLTVGASWKLDKQSSINLSFTHGFEESVKLTNPNIGPQTGSINLNVNELEIGWSRTY